MAETPIQVLLIEDNPGDVLLLQELLGEVPSVQCQLTSVERLDKALQILKQESFDVILVDLTLPDSNGLETFVTLHNQVPAIPIIVQTGLNDETLAMGAMQQGAQDYLVKGQVSGDLLVRCMRYAMERQRAEEALRQSEERFRSLSASAPIGIYQTDADGICIYTNELWQEISGLTLEESLGRAWVKCIHPEDQEMVTNIWNQFIHGGGEFSLEFRFLTSQGDVRWVFGRATAMKSQGGKIIGYVGVNEDITQRKQAQEKIREQAALLDVTTDAIFVRNLENRILFWNKGAENIYGWQESEVYGKNTSELFYQETPPEVESALLATMSRGKWQGELSKLNQSGKEILVESRWTLVCDEKGKPKSILTVDTDITEKKQLESQFFRTQRLESIGTLASGIAHDLNNILTPILAASQLLPMKFPDADEQSQHLFEILEDSTKRATDLVKQVLSFARGVQGKRIHLQMRHLAKELTKILKETFPKSIEVSLDIPNNLWMVSGDSTQLHQVLMNLCVNARDAMPEGGKLRIAAENIFIDENYARMNLEAKVGPYIAIAVSDSGAGISADVLERIFEPFFTTKEVGKGTGLGLATVLGIVKSHGGFLNVHSEEGQGTCFKVYLPAVEGIETQEEEDLQPTSGNGQLILVVDDESSITEITRASLEGYNYQTMIANDGIEAIAIFAQHKDKIHLVLMDMMMPSLDGLTAIRTMKKISPEVKIIASSGLMSSNKMNEAKAAGIKAFLPKPYTVKELLHTIQQVIE
ncbi:PAS domain S-box protein [Calothrix rhizosoleniae]|uniref:hybrid sensor histidine kinase/response regulator n=1 Tax=Calothrix rhizosoleniae TaxID=888997 RepID=UPI000B49A622|nr:PAS domain S-box protein [Calothrix rhizosoleniae]